MLHWKYRQQRQQYRSEQAERQRLERDAETDRLLWATQKSHAEGDYPGALERARACLETDPDRLEARLLEARILADMDQPDLAALDRLAKDHPGEGGVLSDADGASMAANLTQLASET